MATIDVGKLSFNHKGDYSSSTAYVLNDVVYYNGSAYIAKQATTNNVPTNATYWNLFVLKGTDTSVLTTQGDVLYHTGSALARLSAGTNGHFLKTQGSGAAPVWAAVSAGIKQIKFSPAGTTQYTVGSTSYTDVGANYTLTITPISASNRILLYTQFADQGNSAGRTYYNFNKSGDSSGNGDLIANGGWSNVENINTAGNGFTSGMMVDNSIASTNALTYKLRLKTNGNNSHVNVADSISFMMAIELDGGLF